MTCSRADFPSIRDRYLKAHPCCEKCGRYVGVEVHHIKPLSLGGTNDEDNLQTLCAECHKKAHLPDRGECTSRGMRKDRFYVEYIYWVDLLEYLIREYENEDGNIPYYVKEVLETLEYGIENGSLSYYNRCLSGAPVEVQNRVQQFKERIKKASDN